MADHVNRVANLERSLSQADGRNADLSKVFYDLAYFLLVHLFPPFFR
jgi:hypothetical protein